MNALARQLAGRVGKTKNQRWLGEDLMRIAFVARTSDSRASEMLMGATEGERGGLSARLTEGRGRRLRSLVRNKQPRTQVSEPAKP